MIEPEQALALWDEFPVNRQPRPIVLMSSTIGPGGAPMVEDRVQVLRHAPVVSDVEIPAWLLAALQPDPAPHWHVEPVRVRSVRRACPEFRTDRGHRPLPAYRVEFAGTLYRPGKAPSPKHEGLGYPPMHALEPAVEETMWWPAELSTNWRGGLRGLPPAVLTDHGRTVQMIVSASPPYCTDVRVRTVLESRTAVLLVVEEKLRPGVQAVPLVAVGRHVTASLSEPLAARALLQADGIPIEVLPG